MRNVILRKKSLTVVTDKEAASWNNYEGNKGAVLVTVPANMDKDERLAYVKAWLNALRQAKAEGLLG